jgi:hypothetical protein
LIRAVNRTGCEVLTRRGDEANLHPFAQRRGDAAQVEAGEVCPGEVSTAQHEPQVGGEDALDVAAVEPTIGTSLSAGADPRVAA